MLFIDCNDIDDGTGGSEIVTKLIRNYFDKIELEEDKRRPRKVIIMKIIGD